MPPQVVREVDLRAMRRTLCIATPLNEATPATVAEVEQGCLLSGILIAWGRVERRAP
jgi:hypothetical protein